MSELIIKQLAKEKGVSMKEVAKAAGYRQTTSLYQKLSRSGLTTKQLDSIAHVLGVSVPDLFSHDTTDLTCPHCGNKFTLTIKTEKTIIYGRLQKEI